MQTPLQVTFHNLPHSDAIHEEIRTRADKLDALYDRIIGCRVVVDSPHRGKVKAKTYEVRIDISVPGHELIINHEPHTDFRVAINGAFDNARRRLKTHVQRQRGK